MLNKSALVRPAKMVIVILYLVGVVGFSMQQAEPLFRQLSPYNLLLSLAVLLFFHREWSVRQVVVLLMVALFGFVAELIGTQTGMLFGNYSYGPVLGYKVMDTPLLIGVNWLVLCYGFYVLLTKLKLIYTLPLVGALLMVGFDFVMEPVAVRLDMWSWQEGLIPFKNYIDWFLLSFLLLLLMQLTKLKLINALAVWIVVCQFVFFLVLNVTLMLV